MKYVDNPENNETVSKILNEMEYAEQYLLNWKAYWYERYENIILPENFSLMPSDAQEELGLNIYAHFIKYDKKGTLVPIRNVEVANNYGVCTIEWNGITTNKCSRRIAFNSDGNITLEKDKRDYSKRKLDYNINYNVDTEDFEIRLNELKEIPIDTYSKIISNNYTVKKVGKILTKKTGNNFFNFEIKYDLLTKEKNIYIYTKKSNGKINGIYRLFIEDNNISKIMFYSRKGKKQEMANKIVLPGVNGYLHISYFNSKEDEMDNLVNEIISEIPIKGLENSINQNVIKKKEIETIILKKKNK